MMEDGLVVAEDLVYRHPILLRPPKLSEPLHELPLLLREVLRHRRAQYDVEVAARAWRASVRHSQSGQPHALAGLALRRYGQAHSAGQCRDVDLSAEDGVFDRYRQLEVEVVTFAARAGDDV